jgi:hypothetical protein
MANEDNPLKLVGALSGLAGTAIGVLISFLTVMTDLAALEERVGNLQKTITSGMDDRYRGQDARRDLAMVELRIGSNARAIENLQKLMRHHIDGDHDGHEVNDP